MLFNSYEFLLLFLPATLLGYYALRRWGSVHAGLVFLVSASLFFYGWWESGYLVLILGSSVFNFLCGRSIGARDKAGQSTATLLAFGVAVNLGLLGYFKYANFLIDTVNDLSGGGFGTLNIVLPLAISFFTFQQVAFLVDSAQGKVEEPSFLGYLLFVTFFPQLIAGPIVHHRETIPQFFHSAQAHQIWRNLAVGFTIATIGLFKKTVLAERAGYWGDQSFSLVAQGTDISFIEAWTGTLGFSFEIYFDFSGYSDMAIGLARMFGIILPLNFASPYKATSIIEFWRCWHMTLSRFLRDYLYIPLGGNRLGPIRRYANLFVVMVLGGLWHGANWTFVVWGGLHGVYLAINYAWRGWRGDQSSPSLAGRWGGRVLTFLAVSVAWVFFRAESFGDAMVMLRGLAGLNGVVLPAHYAGVLGGLAPWLGDLGLVFGAVPAYSGGWQIMSLAALLGFVWFFPNTQEILRDYEPSLDNKGAAERPVGLAWVVWHPTLTMGIVSGIIASYLALSLLQGNSGEFIYFQF